jgi:8-oxo-dGTP diphosphatase
MKCYFAEVVKGSLTLKEHEAARWLGPDELSSVDWLPADLGLIEKLKQTL